MILPQAMIASPSTARKITAQSVLLRFSIPGSYLAGQRSTASTSRVHTVVDRITGMTILFMTLAVAFAAFCVWLMVRIVNRGWKPGRRFGIFAGLAVLSAYPLSFGPFTAIAVSGYMPNSVSAGIYPFYRPIEMIGSRGPEPFKSAVNWYAHCCNGLLNR